MLTQNDNSLPLTLREIDVIAAFLYSSHSKIIAQFLNIEPRTVETHIYKIMSKLKCRSRHHILEHAISSDFVQSIVTRYQMLCLTYAYNKVHQEKEMHQLYNIKIRYPETISVETCQSFIKVLQEDFTRVKVNILNNNAMDYKDHVQIVYNLEKRTILQKQYYLALQQIINILSPSDNEKIRKIEESLQKSIDPLIQKSCEFSSQKNLLKVPMHKEIFNISRIQKIFFCTAIILMICFAAVAFNPSSNTIIQMDFNLPPQEIFLNRSSLVQALKKAFKNDHHDIQIVTITGIAGAGKTTLARYFARASKASVVWEMNAENAVSLMDSFKNLAFILANDEQSRNQLGYIFQIPEDQVKIKQLVIFTQKKLKEQKEWLLIFDNVENFSDIRYCFPKDVNLWGRGKVIITTRNQNIKNADLIVARTLIELNELSKEESLELFKKIYYQERLNQINAYEKASSVKFLEHIPSFPLDICMAAYFIRATKQTFREYIDNISLHNKSFNQKQSKLSKEISDYAHDRFSILVTILEKLLGTRSEYKKYLFLLFSMNSQKIPYALFESYENTQVAREFLQDLRKFSLIADEKVDERPTLLFSVHRSTQEIGKSYILQVFSQEDLERCVKSVQALIKAYVKNNENSPTKITNLVSHLEVISKTVMNLDISVTSKKLWEQEIYSILGYSYLKFLDDYAHARQYLSLAYSSAKTQKQISDAELANILRSLSHVCAIFEDLDEAIAFAHEGFKFSQNMPNSQILTASILSNLGYMYMSNNDFQKSINYYCQALTTLPSQQSEEKLLTESSINRRLATLYSFTFLNKPEAMQGIHILEKTLKRDKAIDLDFELKTVSNKMLTEIVRNKIRLAYSYVLMQNIIKAKNIIEEINSIQQKTKDLFLEDTFKYFKNLIEAYISIQENQINDTIQILNSLLKKIDEFPYKNNIWIELPARVMRAKAFIHSKSYEQAYADCEAIFKVKRKLKTLYWHLLFAENFYNAAVAKYHLQDFVNAIRHLNEFLNDIQDFCQMFLLPKQFQKLKDKNIFKFINQQEAKNNPEIIKECLKRCEIIFASIHKTPSLKL